MTTQIVSIVLVIAGWAVVVAGVALLTAVGWAFITAGLGAVAAAVVLYDPEKKP